MDKVSFTGGVTLIFCALVLACRCQNVPGRRQRSGPECTLPLDSGTCNMNISRYYFDLATKSCKPFTFSGCGGNLNNFETERDCNMRCICSRPVRTGNGNKDLVRYFYNVDTASCEQYRFTGKGGNSNRFPSMQSCSETCIEETMASKRCSRRPEFGTDCGNSTVQFFYDKNCDCCREFTYLGCGGNGNRFDSAATCITKCSAENGAVTPTVNPNSRPNMCNMPSDKGPCSQNVRRYFYDVKSGSCKQFTYSGCGGNGNNFLIRSECTKICNSGSASPKPTTAATPMSRCYLPLKRGNCDRINLRFYYNKSTRSCRMFLFSGCGGNENNFATYMDCIGTCEAQ